MWSPKVTHSTRCIAGFGHDEASNEGEVCSCSKVGLFGVAKRPGRHAAPRDHLIKEARKKSRSRWRPFLRTLKPAPCPWTWNARTALLQGTELEAVVQGGSLGCGTTMRGLKERVSRRTYAHACYVAPREPLVRLLLTRSTALNYSKKIITLEDEDSVIGRARFDTHAGEPSRRTRGSY